MLINTFFKKLLLLSLLTSTLFSYDFSISGFGTLSGIYNDNDKAHYRKVTIREDGSKRDLYYKTDSLLGLQTSLYLDEKNSFNIQGLFQENAYSDMKPLIDWANYKYQSDENYHIKLGRIRLPIYKNSDNLNVGFSNTMIREPIEVYGGVPIYAYDGVEFLYSGLYNDYLYTIQLGYGEETLKAPFNNGEIKFEFNNLMILNLEFGTNALYFKATYMQVTTYTDNKLINSMYDTLRFTKHPTLVNVANRYDSNNKKVHYYSLGAFSEYENFTFELEYAERKSDTITRSLEAHRAFLGYTLNDLTLYTSYSKSKMNDSANLGVNPVPALDPIWNGIERLLINRDLSQRTNSLGLKYYISDNVDLKVQYDSVNIKSQQAGFHKSVSSNVNAKYMNVISFALDFVF